MVNFLKCMTWPSSVHPHHPLLIRTLVLVYPRPIFHYLICFFFFFSHSHVLYVLIWALWFIAVLIWTFQGFHVRYHSLYQIINTYLYCLCFNSYSCTSSWWAVLWVVSVCCFLVLHMNEISCFCPCPLTHFAQHHILQFHLKCSKLHNFMFSNRWVVF